MTDLDAQLTGEDPAVEQHPETVAAHDALRTALDALEEIDRRAQSAAPDVEPGERSAARDAVDLARAAIVGARRRAVDALAAEHDAKVAALAADVAALDAPDLVALTEKVITASRRLRTAVADYADRHAALRDRAAALGIPTVSGPDEHAHRTSPHGLAVTPDGLLVDRTTWRRPSRPGAPLTVADEALSVAADPQRVALEVVPLVVVGSVRQAEHAAAVPRVERDEAHLRRTAEVHAQAGPSARQQEWSRLLADAAGAPVADLSQPTMRITNDADDATPGGRHIGARNAA